MKLKFMIKEGDISVLVLRGDQTGSYGPHEMN